MDLLFTFADAITSGFGFALGAVIFLRLPALYVERGG